MYTVYVHVYILRFLFSTACGLVSFVYVCLCYQQSSHFVYESAQTQTDGDEDNSNNNNDDDNNEREKK